MRVIIEIHLKRLSFEGPGLRRSLLVGEWQPDLLSHTHFLLEVG